MSLPKWFVPPDFCGERGKKEQRWGIRIQKEEKEKFEGKKQEQWEGKNQSVKYILILFIKEHIVIPKWKEGNSEGGWDGDKNKKSRAESKEVARIVRTKNYGQNAIPTKRGTCGRRISSPVMSVSLLSLELSSDRRLPLPWTKEALSTSLREKKSQRRDDAMNSYYECMRENLPIECHSYN